ncbi:unnamed protein product [Cyclocybe aegerita]|uniref:ER-bound oxygenase mpaB/mpaB'/Rubber oxygenase catalytic domain-containing protein n=1 Tax=Cyclocybe aegerita TaxID=1973307 RepID=A0A8S0W173_CYCAE|nr:unnamed protein product [Cyclocybe aegerita]
MGTHFRDWSGDGLFSYDYLFLRATVVIGQLRCLSSAYALLAGLLIWLVVVRLLRWRHYNAIHSEYGPKWNDGKGSITPEEAQKIVNLSTLYDMPLLTYYALSFGLVGSYAIPTIAKLLYSTKQVKSPEAISRRYVDTEIFVTTWLNCPMSGFVDLHAGEKRMSGDKQQPAEDPRAMIALARVNYLHSQYKILNEDYMYTLSLFIRNTIVDRFGWRRLSPLEKEAYYVYWAEIGRRMKIQDIPDSLDEFTRWSEDYEEKRRVPRQENHALTDSTLNDILPVPNAFGIKALAKKMLLCFVDEGMRKATMFENPPWYTFLLVNIAMGAIAFCQRWLMLPEFTPRSVVDMDVSPKYLKSGQFPRLHPRIWGSIPWYRPEATGLGYLRDRLLVALGWYAEAPGPRLRSQGYRLEEMASSP